MRRCGSDRGEDEGDAEVPFGQRPLPRARRVNKEVEKWQR